MAEFEELDDELDGDELDGDEITVEQRARTMGWKPADEFRGDPRLHIGAAEFIEKGERELPILRDQNRRMSEKLVKVEGDMSALRNTIEEQGEAIRNAMQMARNANEAGFNRAITEMKAKQRNAAAEGDIEAFDQIDEQIRAAETERAATVDDHKNHVTTKVPEPPKPAPQLDPETTDFIAANPWFNANPILNQAMVSAHAAIMSREGVVKGAALADQYERAKAEVVDMFPHKFRTEKPMADDTDPNPGPAPRPRPRLTPALDPSGAPVRTRRSADPFDQIADAADRAEARKAFESIQKWDSGATPEEYVALYLNPKLNPMELREQRNKKAN